MSLIHAKEGERVTVVDVDESYRRRFARLGVVPGTEINILAQSLHGGCVFLCRGIKWAMEMDMAQRITVEPIS
ncbi:MAG: FeoA family protein [Planctomycetia bacterium]|nr:FeoA family protein [Planctomycetia bacterium]